LKKERHYVMARGNNYDKRTNNVLQNTTQKTWDFNQCNDPFLFLGLWCLMPLSTILQFIMAVYFIGGGHRSTQRKLNQFLFLFLFLQL